jgi:hypothetical protein
MRATLIRAEATVEKQNITLSLPKDVLRKAERLAAQRQTSVSGLLAHALERMVEQEDAYCRARRRHLEWLDHGADLGTGGHIATGRDDLHERT